MLVVPKQHIDSLEALKQRISRLWRRAQGHTGGRKITGVAEQGYRVIVNCGPRAGQTVMHLHYHVLGG